MVFVHRASSDAVRAYERPGQTMRYRDLQRHQQSFGSSYRGCRPLAPTNLGRY